MHTQTQIMHRAGGRKARQARAIQLAIAHDDDDQMYCMRGVVNGLLVVVPLYIAIAAALLLF